MLPATRLHSEVAAAASWALCQGWGDEALGQGMLSTAGQVSPSQTKLDI